MLRGLQGHIQQCSGSFVVPEIDDGQKCARNLCAWNLYCAFIYSMYSNPWTFFLILNYFLLLPFGELQSRVCHHNRDFFVGGTAHLMRLRCYFWLCTHKSLVEMLRAGTIWNDWVLSLMYHIQGNTLLLYYLSCNIKSSITYHTIYHLVNLRVTNEVPSASICGVYINFCLIWIIKTC